MCEKLNTNISYNTDAEIRYLSEKKTVHSVKTNLLKRDGSAPAALQHQV